jgi:hypothetical protein
MEKSSKKIRRNRRAKCVEKIKKLRVKEGTTIQKIGTRNKWIIIGRENCTK